MSIGKWNEFSYYNKELDDFLKGLNQKEFNNIDKYLSKNTELSISLGKKEFFNKYTIDVLTFNNKNESFYFLNLQEREKLEIIIPRLLKMKEIIKSGFYWEYEITVIVHYKKESIFLKGFYNYCNYKLNDHLLFENNTNSNDWEIQDNLDNVEVSKEFKEKIKQAVFYIENGNDRLITDGYSNGLKTSSYDIQKNEIEI